MGLREEKKRKTRKNISDIATQLFIERGYHQVTTAEIAEKALVSVPTIFNYFPSKESLVFDEDEDTEKMLIDSVLNRKKDDTIVEALLKAGLSYINEVKKLDRKNFEIFMNLVNSTPELSIYAKQMWLRHERALAGVILKESKRKLSLAESGAIARFVLDAYNRAVESEDPESVLITLFSILKDGWKEQ